jgi:hypothetical protein
VVQYSSGKFFGHQEFLVFHKLFIDGPWRGKLPLKSKDDAATFPAGVTYWGTVTYVPEVIADDFASRPGHYKVT